MHHDYVISLKRPSYKALNAISLLLLFLFLLAFISYSWQIGWGNLRWYYYLVPIFIVLQAGYNLLIKNHPEFIAYYRLPLLLSAFSWQFVFYGKLWWLTIAYGLLALAERYLKFPNEIGFSKEGVVQNSFPRKKFEWVEIENSMIRDNLFTLDLRNNKIIQKELEEPVSKEIETDFNLFCKNMLHFEMDKEQ